MAQLQLSPGHFGCADGMNSGSSLELNIPSVLQCLGGAVLGGSWVPWCGTVPSTLCQGLRACWHTVCKHSMLCSARVVGGAHKSDLRHRVVNFISPNPRHSSLRAFGVAQE